MLLRPHLVSSVVSRAASSVAAATASKASSNAAVSSNAVFERENKFGAHNYKPVSPEYDIRDVH